MKWNEKLQWLKLTYLIMDIWHLFLEMSLWKSLSFFFKYAFSEIKKCSKEMKWKKNANFKLQKSI